MWALFLYRKRHIPRRTQTYDLGRLSWLPPKGIGGKKNSFFFLPQKTRNSFLYLHDIALGVIHSPHCHLAAGRIAKTLDLPNFFLPLFLFYFFTFAFIVWRRCCNGLRDLDCTGMRNGHFGAFGAIIIDAIVVGVAHTSSRWNSRFHMNGPGLRCYRNLATGWIVGDGWAGSLNVLVVMPGLKFGWIRSRSWDAKLFLANQQILVRIDTKNR